MPTVRPATPDDAGEILAMIRELAEFERAPDAVKASEEDLRRDGWGRRPRFVAFMAEDGGGVVGYALAFPNYSTWEGRAGLHLEDLYVRPRARGAGVGILLIAAVAREAVARGCPRLDLQVLDWNPARKVYERLGFRHMAEWLPYRIEGEALVQLATRTVSPS